MHKNPRGFTLFFATLVAALALSVGLAMYDLTVRQLQLSGTALQSQSAIYAADTGAECALYWDSHWGSGGSAFATSSASTPPSSGVLCNTYDVAANGTQPATYQIQPSGWTPWNIVSSASAATTTFSISLAAGTSRCTLITVAKYMNGTVPHTTITAHGYNTCIAGSPDRLERVLQVTY